MYFLSNRAGASFKSDEIKHYIEVGSWAESSRSAVILEYCRNKTGTRHLDAPCARPD